MENKNERTIEGLSAMIGHASPWAQSILQRRVENLKSKLEPLSDGIRVADIEKDLDSGADVKNEHKCCCCCHSKVKFADHPSDNIEKLNEEDDIEDCEDFENEDECPFAESRNVMEAINEYRSAVTDLVKHYNGILDKSVAIDILTGWFKEDSIYKLYDLDETIGEYEGPRQEAIMAINEAESYNILEWRNLLMTRKGYKRLVKMFSELNSVAVASSMGVKLNVGCTFPSQWES